MGEGFKVIKKSASNLKKNEAAFKKEKSNFFWDFGLKN